ncbi:MAG TPA: tyrosine-type recombinase/integrase, partial [Flavobacteriales bacterium]|nr:tyrosine-type recombinase/integrase [Flavobacteriales bacterium]
MNWQQALTDLRVHLKLERSLSDRTVDGYLRDVGKLREYAEAHSPALAPEKMELGDLQAFVTSVAKRGLSPASQARLLSAVRSFYKSLRIEKVITNDPTELLESPKLGRYLPTFLTVEEIDAIIGAIDMSRPLAHRDRAIIETLYSCGLRVSELCGLRMSWLHFADGFVRVIGKGDKERLVPIGPAAITQITRYREDERTHLPVQRTAED